MMHSLNGSLEINRKSVNFSDGRGYIEKDWGGLLFLNNIFGYIAITSKITLLVYSFLSHISPFYFTEFEGLSVILL